MVKQYPALIDALQDPALYDHPVEYFRVVETHISWVLLTGRYAYKIKKPVDLGFLDFSTLALRRFYCEEEVRLNRRLAPQLYLGVIPIAGTPARPQPGGGTDPFEYAVKMRQFDPEQQFDHLMAANRLTTGHIDRLAQIVAQFHEGIDRAPPADRHGEPEVIHGAVVESLEQIDGLLPGGAQRARLQRVHRWCDDARDALEALMRERKARGFIRECHGDLHLANITRSDDEVVVFDCLEFNDNLRWIDTMSEVAFLVMDLDAHHRSDLGNRFLNDYLHFTGDHEGLRLLRYYQTYRALVRAKVACIRKGQSDQESADNGPGARTYLALAQRYTRGRPVAMIIAHGLSGSGKSTVTAPLSEQCGALRVRSDVERKRLFGLPPEARTGSRPGADLYGHDANDRTYERLAELATHIIESGHPAIVDAAFLRRGERDRFRDLARRLRVPFIILDFHAPHALLRRWITERERTARDASEAGVEVLEQQIASRQPLEAHERTAAITVDTAAPVDIPALAAALGPRLRRAQRS